MQHRKGRRRQRQRPELRVDVARLLGLGPPPDAEAGLPDAGTHADRDLARLRQAQRSRLVRQRVLLTLFSVVLVAVLLGLAWAVVVAWRTTAS